MKKGLILFVIFFCIPSLVYANHHQANNDRDALNHIANQVWQLGKQEKYDEAKRVLGNFTDVFLKHTSEHELAMKDIKIIIYAYERAEAAITQVKMDHDERVQSLTQFRLAVDALSSEHQPLWKDTKSMVMTPLQKAIVSLDKKDRDKFQFYLNDFFGKYEMIRPALVISLSRPEMERIDSYTRFLEKQRSSIENTEKIKAQLADVEQAFSDLFDGTSEESSSNGLFEVIIFVGGAIVITLIYVGWRKYKGQKAEEKTRERDRI